MPEQIEITREALKQELERVDQVTIDPNWGWAAKLDLVSVHAYYIPQHDDQPGYIAVQIEPQGVSQTQVEVEEFSINASDFPDADKDPEEWQDYADEYEPAIKFPEAIKAELHREFDQYKSRTYNPTEILPGWTFQIRVGDKTFSQTTNERGVAKFENLPAEIGKVTLGFKPTAEPESVGAEEVAGQQISVSFEKKDRQKPMPAKKEYAYYRPLAAAAIFLVILAGGVGYWVSQGPNTDPIAEDKPKPVFIALVKPVEGPANLSPDTIEADRSYLIQLKSPQEYWQVFRWDKDLLMFVDKGAPTKPGEDTQVETPIESSRPAGDVFLIVVSTKSNCNNLAQEFKTITTSHRDELLELDTAEVAEARFHTLVNECVCTNGNATVTVEKRRYSPSP